MAQLLAPARRTRVASIRDFWLCSRRDTAHAVMGMLAHTAKRPRIFARTPRPSCVARMGIALAVDADAIQGGTGKCKPAPRAFVLRCCRLDLALQAASID